MNNTHRVRFLLLSVALFSVLNLSAQLEFTKRGRLIFVGSEQIKGKQLVAGVHVTPRDSFSLDLKIDVLIDWKVVDSLAESVSIDHGSILENKYFVKLDTMNYPCYRFVGKSGLEIRIAKNERLAQIQLPKKRKSHVRSLPLMYEK